MEFKLIRYNKFYITKNELTNIQDAIKQEKLSGDGKYSKLCEKFIEEKFDIKKAFLTPSCTAALEMAALVLDIKPGDEVIMPSFTFVSTANAFVLRGAVPVFVDIDLDNLNIDPRDIKKNLTKKTKAVVVVHYGGFSCNMDEISAICNENNLFLIEDAAHAINAKYKNKYLGSIGDLATLSFHDTKNITCGEGGALLINNNRLVERAEIIREKGTNRTKFFKGEVDKYTWVDTGSSFLLSEIAAAFLYAQLENVEQITSKRIKIWNYYYDSLLKLSKKGFFNLPRKLEYATHNAHNFYLLTRTSEERDLLIKHLKDSDIYAVFHYIPLHNSPAGELYSNSKSLPVTEDIYSRLIRLPLYPNLKRKELNKIIFEIKRFFNVKG